MHGLVAAHRREVDAHRHLENEEAENRRLVVKKKIPFIVDRRSTGPSPVCKRKISTQGPLVRSHEERKWLFEKPTQSLISPSLVYEGNPAHTLGNTKKFPLIADQNEHAIRIYTCDGGLAPRKAGAVLARRCRLRRPFH